jgi:perosamine synthetase
VPVYQFVGNMTSDKAFFFYRGSIALYALLKAMEVEPGDEVILQSFTCDIVPTTVVRAGGTPIYVDIDPNTFNMDSDKIEERITERTKAIIVQHTYGIPTEMGPILDIARRHDLGVIEDSCHAWGSRCGGQEVGTFGDAAFYSFGWHKPLVLGVGGCAVVNNPALRQKVERLYGDFVTPAYKEAIILYLQYFAYSWLLNRFLFWSVRDIYRKVSNRGLRGLITGIFVRRKMTTTRSGQVRSGMQLHHRRMIPLQEGRLFRKLKRFDRMVAHQRWVVSQYERLLPRAGYGPLELDSRFEPIFYKYPVLSDRKRDIFEQAPQARIELSYLFSSPVDPRKPGLAKLWRTLGYREGMCPIAEDTSDRIVALPVHSRVRAADIRRTIAFLASFQ